MSTTTPTVDELLAEAGVHPEDSPGTVAARLWGRLAETHRVPAVGSLATLGVVDRVVLVLLDVTQLPPETVASWLHTDAATVVAAHDAARQRVGLPTVRTTPCAGWAEVRDAHAATDPAAISALVAHVQQCEDCGPPVPQQRDARRGWARRAVTALPGSGGALGVLPAFAAAVVATGAVVGGGTVVGSALTADPLDDLPVPVVVEESPGLPSDEEPPGGWPTPVADAPPGDDRTPTGAEPADDRDAPPAPTDQLDDLVDDTDTATDTVDGLLDRLTGELEDTTDRLEGTTDDVTDGLDDTVGDVTEQLDDADDADDTGDGGDGIELP